MTLLEWFHQPYFRTFVRYELFLHESWPYLNKLLFDKLYLRKSEIQAELEGVPGSLEWERIDNKRASRIALYHQGVITDTPEKLAQLQAWGVEAMNRFQKVIDHHVNEAI